jgi:hypothetical protein
MTVVNHVLYLSGSFMRFLFSVLERHLDTGNHSHDRIPGLFTGKR